MRRAARCRAPAVQSGVSIGPAARSFRDPAPSPSPRRRSPCPPLSPSHSPTSTPHTANFSVRTFSSRFALFMGSAVMPWDTDVAPGEATFRQRTSRCSLPPSMTFCHRRDRCLPDIATLTPPFGVHRVQQLGMGRPPILSKFGRVSLAPPLPPLPPPTPPPHAHHGSVRFVSASSPM